MEKVREAGGGDRQAGPSGWRDGESWRSLALAYAAVEEPCFQNGNQLFLKVDRWRRHQRRRCSPQCSGLSAVLPLVAGCGGGSGQMQCGQGTEDTPFALSSFSFSSFHSFFNSRLFLLTLTCYYCVYRHKYAISCQILTLILPLNFTQLPSLMLCFSFFVLHLVR